MLSATNCIFYTILVFVLYSCDKHKDANNTAIPYIPISEKFNINDPRYQNLNNIGGWIYYPAGSRGLILYRENSDDIRAYERHCTYDPDQVCSTVDMDVALLQANDYDCCGSIFSLLNGNVLRGPATRPLLQYSTTFDGTFVSITN